MCFEMKNFLFVKRTAHLFGRRDQTAAYYSFLFTELRRRGAVAMKNFLGTLLLALKNFLKTVIVRAAGASGLVKVLRGCFIKISWQYRGYVSRKVRRGEFQCILLKGFADFLVLTATMKFNPRVIPRFRQISI